MKRHDPNNTVIETCSQLCTVLINDSVQIPQSSLTMKPQNVPISSAHSFSSYKVELRSVRPQNSVSAMYCGVKSCRYKPL